MAHITDRFCKSQWGVFTHYLGIKDCTTPEEWNAKVNSFDVKKLAEQLKYIGARYYFITIMQGGRWMLGPNDTYNKITGFKPGEACSERDLVAEIIEELDKHGIDTYLYYTGDGPHLDEVAGRAMGMYEGDMLKENPMYNMHPVTEEFVQKWTAVLEEYAVRYGEGVKGWWFDGMYDVIGYHQELIDYYKRAVKKGNPNAICAFNNGVKGGNEMNWGHGDFITGEATSYEYIPTGRFRIGGQQHLLVTLGFDPETGHGSWWRKGSMCSKEYLRAFMNRAKRDSSVITYDIWIDNDGSFDPEQMEYLRYMEFGEEK